MAARKTLWHPEEVRQKIQVSQLINRLTDHALSAVPIMDASQVNAAKALIGKVLPDLKALEHSGEIETRYVAELPSVVQDPDEWARQYAPKQLQ